MRFLTLCWRNSQCILSPNDRVSERFNIMILLFSWWSPHSAMANLLDCGHKVSKFKLQLCYYAYFLTHTFGKGMNSLISSAMGWIELLLFFYKDGFGIIYPMKFNMPLNKETNQTNSFFYYWSGCLMFPTLLATIHFHSILYFTLFHIRLNCLPISSSYNHGSLPSSYYWSLGYHSSTAWIHL